MTGDGPARGLLRRYARSRVPTTAAGVEIVLAGAFLGFRALNVSQALIALPSGVAESPRPLVDIAAMVVLVAESLTLAAAIYRRGAYRSARLGWTDAVVAIALLASTVLFTHPADRFTNCADWGYPVSMSGAFGAGIVFRRWQHVVIPPLALAATYLATTAPNPPPVGGLSSAITNAFSYPIFAGLAWLLATYLRRIGADADAARARAADLATRLERERHKNLLHDHVTVLDVLSRGDADDRLTRTARTRAASSSAQIRAFLRGDVGPAGSLAGEPTAVAADFPHLPLTANVALATRELPSPVTAAISTAVRTLLDNVAWHAHAGEVVLHADTTADRWEVTVTDDGIGYDAATTPERYGLATQVRTTIAAIGGTTTITTAPGHGTTTRLTGRSSTQLRASDTAVTTF